MNENIATGARPRPASALVRDVRNMLRESRTRATGRSIARMGKEVVR